MKVTHTETMFTMTGKHWSGTYPISDLPKWLNFYQRLRADFPKSGSSYDKCIEELEYLSKNSLVHILLQHSYDEDINLKTGVKHLENINNISPRPSVGKR